jgi:hypothetical protein
LRLPNLPQDHLKPIWRLRPDRPGPCALALDPREACFVLANGATLDGITYTASFEGWDGIVEADGRVTVRLNPVAAEVRSFTDAAGAVALRVVS